MPFSFCGDGEALLADRLGPHGHRHRCRLDLALGAGLGDQFGHGEGQFAQPLAGESGDVEDPVSALLQGGPDDIGHLFAVWQVRLVQRNQPRPLIQRHGSVGLLALAGADSIWCVGLQLGFDRGQIPQRVPVGLQGAGVEHVDDGRAALHVAQELVAQAFAFGGPGDQSGHIGDGEAGLAGFDHSQVGHQCGERVVGDLGPGR